MDVAAIVGTITQLALGAAAWRLANELKAIVKAHGEQLRAHDERIEVLEKKVP